MFAGTRRRYVSSPMPIADLGDVSLQYELGGDGPPLLVVNGTGSDLRQRPSLLESPLVRHFTVLAYDHRGLGRSRAAQPSRQPVMADFARDAAERAERMALYTDLRASSDDRRRDVLVRILTAAGEAEDPSALPGLRRQLEARRLHDAWERLPSLRVPTLVAAGRYDGIAPLANAEALASRIPAATLRVFEGAHVFMLEDREAWPAMIAFLNER
jgi:pimeloyl-ACP methyl ester carboxylesterase